MVHSTSLGRSLQIFGVHRHTRLNQDIDHVPVLIDRVPKIFPPTLDIHEKFIYVPNGTQAALSSLESPGICGTELQTPLSDALEADCDTALRQEIFNISEAKAESVVKPNRMADDFRRKSVSAIAESVGVHCASLPALTLT